MSSGMPVICTTRARHRPMTAPATTATTIRTMPMVVMPSLSVAARDGEGDGGDEGDGHARDAEPDALLRRLVLREPREAHDEQKGGYEVRRDRDRVDGHRWNISSMRRVTAKPPKMLMLASRIATKASTVTIVSPVPI